MNDPKMKEMSTDFDISGEILPDAETVFWSFIGGADLGGFFSARELAKEVFQVFHLSLESSVHS